MGNISSKIPTIRFSIWKKKFNLIKFKIINLSSIWSKLHLCNSRKWHVTKSAAGPILWTYHWPLSDWPMVKLPTFLWCHDAPTVIRHQFLRKLAVSVLKLDQKFWNLLLSPWNVKISPMACKDFLQVSYVFDVILKILLSRKL